MAGELAFREAIFAWLRTRQLHTPYFTRDDLSRFEYGGRTHRLIGPYTGIWRLKEFSDAAIGISTAYVDDGRTPPYEDSMGTDGLPRYKWRGTDPRQADNVSLRRAMERGLPLVYYVGIGYVPGTRTQLFKPNFPVYLVAEEPAQHQFVVAVEEGQRAVTDGEQSDLVDIARRYNERLVKARFHQPLFRARVIHAYEERCAVCRLPFTELLEAAHIKPDSQGGPARISNGLSLCKIHHGAYDADILGISPDYRVHIQDEVLRTFDGPTLQHSLKEMDGENLRQLPADPRSKPDRDYLAERFERFKKAS